LKVFICLVGSYLTGHVFPYTTELFPSTVRGFATGFWSIIGNLSGSLIPYMGVFTDKMHIHFLSGFMPLAFFSFVMSFFMPETMHDTLQN